ncbi:AMP-binding protein [Nonomuraea soli]|uniref:Nonribosomal peptide synthetase MxcG n=1 Tax=Nonomuraea soli TaxID=1032476 RepID=A0A7W0CLZ7_9ACTN|nr:AMP-binding protein [Nonomuraea soli]MBA2893598.1 nonribosomal peptide synthetase MxcG [Nonomuraea soli]
MSESPLTPAQEGIWTGQALDPLSPIYNAGEYVEIVGPLDVERFSAALRTVVDAADALHARFGAGAQVFRREPWSLHVAAPAGLDEALGWMRASLERPVDLAAGPLFTQALFVLGERHHVWYQQIHHIAADGYAFSLLARRVAAVYNGAPAELAPFVPAASTGAERDRSFWLGHLDGAPEPVSLAAPAPLGGVVRSTAALPYRGPDLAERVIAATASHLAAWTGADEVVLGLPVMGRLGTDLLRVPCMAMNIVPLRLRVPYGGAFDALCGQVAGVVRDSRPHHGYRYEWLRRDLRLVGGERRLFGPVVNLLPFRRPLAFGEATGTVRTLSAGPVEDLSVTVSDRVVLEANAAAYSADEVEGHLQSWLEHFGGLLSGRPVRHGSPLDGGPLPAPAVPVACLLRARAAERPFEGAVELGGRRMTYRELMKAAQAFGEHAFGTQAGRAGLAGVMLPRGVEAIVAIVGCALAGVAYLPLDPTWPKARLDAVLADARPDVLVTPSGVRRLSTGSPSGLAYVMYTSGSTGRPKGVAVGNEALAQFVAGASARYGITGEDRVLQFAPLHFDASVEEIFLTLCAGGCLVLRTDDMIASVPRLLQACADLGITVLDLPTAYWHEVAHALAAGLCSLPSGLRTVIIGGEAAQPARVADWHAAVGAGVRLINTYGPTEATVVATAADLEPGDAEAPIGRPLPGVRLAVSRGELVIKGDGVARGYVGGAGFDRVYRTGDRVRVRRDGQLVHLGRVDDQFKISGHRVDPGEVEAALLAHPSVREAAVVGRVGSGGVRHLAAFVVGEAADLREHLRGVLPAALIPGHIAYVGRLPRTGSGKIDRAALRDSLTAAPASVGGSAVSPAVSPAGAPAGAPASSLAVSPVFAAVLDVWREVLGIPEISPDADFFLLGGTSLQTIQVVNRLSVLLGRQIPGTLVFRHPTPTTLAAALQGDAAADAPWERDARLPDDVRPRRTPHAGAVLLTGATGFVGRHLLAELLAATDARVVCPVRDPSRLPGHPRVLAVPTDLTTPGWTAGLPRVDAVYHNAAVVNVTRGYASLSPVNVGATIDVLRLGVPVHHVSTLAVAPPGRPIPEDFVPAHDGLRDGYQRSKWAAEELVRQALDRGLPAAVYRLGRVVGEPNPQDLFWRILRACEQTGARPELDVVEPWTPVGYAAQAIVGLSATGATGVFNLAPRPPVRLGEVLAELLGVPRIPLPAWVERIRALDPALALFFDLAAGAPEALGEVRCERASAFECPPIIYKEVLC